MNVYVVLKSEGVMAHGHLSAVFLTLELARRAVAEWASIPLDEVAEGGSNLLRTWDGGDYEIVEAEVWADLTDAAD